MPLEDTPWPPSADLPPLTPASEAAAVPPGELRLEPPAAGTAAGVFPGRPPVGPSRPRPPHPGFWFALLWCMLLIIVTQVFPAVIGIVVILVLLTNEPGVWKDGNAAGLTEAMMQSRAWTVGMGITFALAEIMIILFSWLVIRLIAGADWPRRLALRRPGLVHLVLVLAAFPAMVLLANGSYEVIKVAWEHLRAFLHLPKLDVPGMEEMVKVFNKWPAGFAVLVIGLGPGIGEELWCRGFLGRGLVGRYGVWGVLATSFFFGLIHLDPAQGTMAMLMGLWLHSVYLATRSLLVPMLLHFLNNSLAVVASRSVLLTEIEENAGSIPLYVYAGAAVLLAAVGWALYQSRARLAAVDGGPPLWRPPYPGVECPPPGSGTRVVHPLPSLAAALTALAGFVVFLACCWAAYLGR
jgi:membrane protease YdiL (CAAX protease family)